jgi:tRNA pseudouridine55 synthase
MKKIINGILLLDKPINITANGALQTVKRLLAARKAGHTGSLDPLATGMLPICLGEATKFSQFLLEANKRYWVVGKLGIKTATGDAEGDIIQQRPVEDISVERLNAVIENFRGAIEQVPSMFSALKHQGRPLYELARKGITIERPARPVTIYELDLLARTPDTLTFTVACSKGTYIRTLIEDIGEALGCGAHVIALRRLSVGAYREEQMVSMAEIERQVQQGDPGLADFLQTHLLPVDSAVDHWPTLRVSEAAIYYLTRGQAIIASGAPTSGWVRLLRHNDEFLGVGEVLDDGRITPRRLVQEIV